MSNNQNTLHAARLAQTGHMPAIRATTVTAWGITRIGTCSTDAAYN